MTQYEKEEMWKLMERFVNLTVEQQRRLEALQTKWIENCAPKHSPFNRGFN